eukprot:gene13403-124_t
MIGQEQPPGTVYTLFYRENKEAPGTCWDVLARWEHFVSATALATTGGDGKNGVLISFSRSGDAHISCNNVTVEVDISCDKLAPAEPKKALVTGVQTNCGPCGLSSRRTGCNGERGMSNTTWQQVLWGHWLNLI